MNAITDPTKLDWSARLARGPFGAAAARGAPLIVAREGGRLAFATPAALALFGVRDLAALESVLFGSASFGARRMSLLARTLTPGAPPRLESLRFFVRRMPVAIGWLCARIVDAQGEAFFVAAAPTRAGEGEAAPAATVELPERLADLGPPEPEGRLRFLWSVDGEGRLGACDPALLDRLGTQAPREGETVAVLAARVGLVPAGVWSEAIAARQTFSAIRVAWPAPGGAHARVALLSGAPFGDRDRSYAGFRGFGVLTGEWTQVAGVRRGEAARPRQAEAEAAPAPPAGPDGEPQARPPDSGLADGDPPAPASPDTAVAEAEPQAQTTGAPDRPALAPAAEPRLATPGAAEPPVASPAKTGRERSGEIVAFRPGSTPSTPPIRPGVFSVLNALSTVAEAPGGGESVALSPQERDAFKEIARALGVRLRSPRLDADLLDPAPPPAAEPEPEPPVAAAPEPVAAAGEPAAGPAEPEPAPAEPELAPAEPEPPPAEPEPPPAEPAPVTRSSEQRDLADLLDQLPIAALVVRGGATLYVNRTLLDLVGYASLEDFREQDGLKAIFRGRDPQAIGAGAEDGGTPIIAAGGEIMTVDAQARPLTWGGEPALLIAMRRGRAAEHRAELRALEREVHRHASLARDIAVALDAVCDGMARVDSEGRLLAMNGAAETLFGYDQKETAGESLLMLFAPSSHAAASAALERVARAESRVETLELDLRNRSGQISPARVDIGRFIEAGTSEIFVLFNDLSGIDSVHDEGVAAREAAEKASAAKTEFLARVSHEIRTPLHAILGFSEVMLEERFGPIGNERYKDYIRDIHASGRHVMSLANDLLDLAKIEAGKMELQFTAVDLNRVIRECVGLMQPQAARERIIVRLSLYEKLPQVMADERSLRQIVFNLLSNAVKYNEPGGQVIVSTALDDAGHTIVRVRDTGIGMNEAELASALEPFQRLAGAKRTEGSGLGLPLTKALVEANHADFAIKSRKEQGTLVEVAFPGMRAAQ